MDELYPLDELYPRDGLKEFAVWCDWDYPNNQMVVHKIEPYDPNKRYPNDLSGIIRAKDELDAWRVVTKVRQ